MPPVRYDRVARLLHWLIGLALLAQIVFGFLLDEIAPRGTPARGPVIHLHKSLGLLLLLLILLRLGWRLRHRPPPWPAALPVWQRQASRLGHRALYACMLLMPLTGYLGSNFSRHGVKFFGLALRPWGPDLPGAYEVFKLLHQLSGWVFTLLILGHVLMALKHHRLLARISLWPWSGALSRDHG